MATINPYLNFQGNTEDAFNFYRSVFGGEFMGGIQRFKDVPGMEDMSEEDGEKVMHVGLPIGKGNYLMGTDTLASMGQSLTMGNNFYICISTDSKEEADQLFDGLSIGGKVEMPMQEAFWGAYFGMFADQFGVQWMISLEKNKDQ